MDNNNYTSKKLDEWLSKKIDEHNQKIASTKSDKPKWTLFGKKKPASKASASQTKDSKAAQDNIKYRTIRLDSTKVNEIDLIRIIMENIDPIMFVFDPVEIDQEYYMPLDDKKLFNRSASAVLSDFDNKYGTHHVGEYNFHSYGSGDKLRKKVTYTVSLPVTIEDRKRVLQRFHASTLGNIYQQIKSSSLLLIIEEKYKNLVLSNLRKTYDADRKSIGLSFEIDPTYIKCNLTAYRIVFTDHGFGTMSSDATKVIALLVNEMVRNWCTSTGLCEEIWGCIHIDLYGGAPLTYTIKLIPNKSLISW